MSDSDNLPSPERDWTCPDCGSKDPHHALYTPLDDRFPNEVQIDVTCSSVYITPIDGGNGFAFDHDTFERIIEHYENRPDFDT